MVLTSRSNFSYLNEISDAGVGFRGEIQIGWGLCCNKTSESRRLTQLDCRQDVLNIFPALCFSSLPLLGEFHLGIFSKCPTVSSPSGMRPHEMFDAVYRPPSCVLASCSFLVLPLPASFDLIHRLVKHSASLLLERNHCSSPLLPCLGGPIRTNTLGKRTIYSLGVGIYLEHLTFLMLVIDSK